MAHRCRAQSKSPQMNIDRRASFDAGIALWQAAAIFDYEGSERCEWEFVAAALVELQQRSG